MRANVRTGCTNCARARLLGPPRRCVMVESVVVEDVVDQGLSSDAPAPEGEPDAAPEGRVDEIAALASALESADELSLDERLELLRRAEAAIARSLEGLDGL
jgi:hypothetical protein